MTSMQEKN